MRREAKLVPTVSRLIHEELVKLGNPEGIEIAVGKQVTEDGYTADLSLETEDKVVVFEIKSGFGARGELGPEIIPSGQAIKHAVSRKYGKEARVVFVSPGGAPKYVRKGLKVTSGSPAYGTDPKSLLALRKYVAGSLKGSRMRKIKSARRATLKKADIR